jgi:outer membrane protein
MHRLQSALALLCIALLLCPLTYGQTPATPPTVPSTLPATAAGGRSQPEMPPFTRPDLGWQKWTKTYRPTEVPPINLSNSNRLEMLIKGGNLYLSVQDAIACAMENNIDIEVQRYGAIIQDANILRAQAGGALRGATPGVANGPTSASAISTTTGIATNAATQSANIASSSQGALIQQTGTAIPNYDPTLVGSLQLGHFTTPQNNSVVSGITALVNNQNTGSLTLNQGFATGTSYSFGYSEVRSSLNSPTYTFNPNITGTMSLTVTQKLLQGFGRAVNTRNITIAKNSREQADLQFRQQVITTISSVLDLYWDLVSFLDNVKSKEEALAYNQRLYSDNKRQVEVGVLAPISIVQAEAAVATAEQDLIVAQTQVQQQETILKDALSRMGIESPTLASAHVIPTDRIRIPETDHVQPYQDQVALALHARPEMATQRINVENNKINARGSRAELLPTLNAFVTLDNNGLAGAANAVTNSTGGSAIVNGTANPYFVGGAGNLLGQIFGRNFPDYAVGLNLNISIRNRTAQADYILDQLTIRQSELALRKQENQIRVDVQNAMIAVQQARVGYKAALKSRILEEQTLDAEQKKLALGTSTVYNVILIQRDLQNAEAAEVSAADAYAKAVVQLDVATGQTLDKYGVEISEAYKGQMSRPPSAIPQQ